MRCQFSGLALMAIVQRTGFGFAGGHAFFDGSDLFGLEGQAAAGALGF
jgi:hypothetical protein